MFRNCLNHGPQTNFTAPRKRETEQLQHVIECGSIQISLFEKLAVLFCVMPHGFIELNGLG